jgi:hypothetical protein
MRSRAPCDPPREACTQCPLLVPWASLIALCSRCWPFAVTPGAVAALRLYQRSRRGMQDLLCGRCPRRTATGRDGVQHRCVDNTGLALVRCGTSVKSLPCEARVESN